MDHADARAELWRRYDAGEVGAADVEARLHLLEAAGDDEDAVRAALDGPLPLRRRRSTRVAAVAAACLGVVAVAAAGVAMFVGGDDDGSGSGGGRGSSGGGSGGVATTAVVVVEPGFPAPDAPPPIPAPTVVVETTAVAPER